jgi:hypothetical protein
VVYELHPGSSPANDVETNDLVTEILQHTQVFEDGVLKLFAHHSTKPELSQLLWELLDVAHELGGSFEEQAHLSIETSSESVLQFATQEDHKMVLRLIEFLERQELRVGYHRVHIVLPNMLLPTRFTGASDSQHKHHEDGKDAGANFERACHKGPCSSQVEIIHHDHGPQSPVVVIFVPPGGMWAGDATALGVTTGKSGQNYKHGVSFGRQADAENGSDFARRLADTTSQYRMTVITNMPKEGQHKLIQLLNEKDRAQPWDLTLPLMLEGNDREWKDYPRCDKSALSSRKGQVGGHADVKKATCPQVVAALAESDGVLSRSQCNSVIGKLGGHADVKKATCPQLLTALAENDGVLSRAQSMAVIGKLYTGGIGGTNRKGNTGSDEKCARNLITNSLRLSAEELAEYKKVHGDLRKFMADTKASSKTAASDLSIDKTKMSQFLCGTLRNKGEVRRTVAAVVEALKPR